MALVKNIKIQVDGNEIKSSYIYNVNLMQSVFGHHILEVVCNREGAFESQDGVILDKSVNKLLGGKISFTIKVIDGEKLEFEGIVMEIHADKMDDFESDTITIEAYSTDILLDDGEHSRSFQDKTVKAIVESILSDYNLPAKKIKPEHSTETMAYTVQYKESSFAFLSRLAAKKGEWFYYDGKDIVFGKRNAESIKLEFRKDVTEFDMSLRMSDLKFKYVSYDYLKDETYEIEADSENISNLSRITQTVLDKSNSKFKHETVIFYNHLLTKDKEEQHLRNRVSLDKKSKSAGFVSCHGVTEKANLKIGGEIKIVDYIDKEGKRKNAPVEHGEFIITELSHSFDYNGNYINNFTAVPLDVEVPPNSSPHAIPFCETQSAIVMDNNDPEELGRVQVQFFWQKPENTVSPWLRIVTPHSGKDQGFFFIPEIDDEVLVAFEGGNAEKPYVIGSHYHGKAKPDPKWINDNNDIKGIRTKGGHTIEFVDKDGGEELKIYDNNNNNYEITLSAHSSAVTIKSKGDLNLKAEGDIKIEAGSNLNLKAGSNMEIKAGNDLKTSAMNATSEASVKMELKASASMKIDGGAQLEQKAAIIRIN